MFTPMMGRPSYFSRRDIGGFMDEVDVMLSTMMGTFDDMFYEPLPMQRMMSRPSYRLLQRSSQANKPKHAHITQDEKQIQVKVEVPGAKAGDVNLQFDDDNRLLRITGETKSEDEGISVHSRFENSFILDRNVDISKISAQMDNGILTITAPKFEELKCTVRRIDVVDNSDDILKLESKDGASHVVDSSKTEEKVVQEKEDNVDDSVLDLDKQ
jgi:HSP20 family protein